MNARFHDRADAGRQLGARLSHLRGQDVIVVGLPRGGMPVAVEVGEALHAPVDLINVRKLGVPWHEELALGAIATGGIRVLNGAVILAAGVTKEDLDQVIRLQTLELERREEAYRGGRPAPRLAGRVVVLVDDGIATGATIRAAIQVVRAQQPARLVVAVPVAPADVAAELASSVDEFECLHAPGDLDAISSWYDAFPQLSDHDVRQVMARSAAEPWATAESVSSR